MNGLIDVTVRGPEAEYVARCGCGWASPVETAIEWADTAMVSHLAKHQGKEAA